MAEIRDIALSRLDPNPFRDGTGSATWESVAEKYEYDERKLQELAQSFEANGVWTGVHVREHPQTAGRFQVIFGHHRVEAARRAKFACLPCVLVEADDSQLVKMMAAENSEEYGHDFALGVMNAVEAVVKAYGMGRVELEKPEPKARGVRFAPSFVQGDEGAHPYTGLAVAAYLGWNTGKAATQRVAPDRVLTALSALELIEKGVLKRSALKGLGSAQARDLVSLTRKALEQEEEKHATQEAFLAKQKKEAEKLDDRNKVRALDKKLEETRQQKITEVAKAGRAAVTQATEFYKQGRSMSEALRATAEKLDLKPAAAAAPKAKVLDLSGVDNFAGALDRTLLEDDSRWRKILLLKEESKAKKPFENLKESLLNLAARAKARAKELN